VDKGIDTGPILLQKEIDITPGDTTGSLYFNSLFPLGIEAIAEAVDLIKSGKAPKISQDDALATYEPPCDDRVAAVDWSKPAPEVYNLVRGCDPQPGAYSTLKGEKVKFYKALLMEATEETSPGRVISIGAGEVVVALRGGTLKIGKLKGEKGAKLAADEFAKEMDLKVGMQFGS
jgi:methionyl-tRNA formyltransferase